MRIRTAERQSSEGLIMLAHLCQRRWNCCQNPSFVASDLNDSHYQSCLHRHIVRTDSPARNKIIISSMYDPYPNNFPNSGVYGERPNPMGRPMEYASKPQMRGHQMPFHQPPQADAGEFALFPLCLQFGNLIPCFHSSIFYRLSPFWSNRLCLHVFFLFEFK